MSLLNIRKWFTASRPQSRTRPRPTVRLGLESLEARDVPAFFNFHIPMPTLPPALVAPAPQAPTLNDQIINFCKSHLQSRVGGGECAQLVSEALRVSGADFTAHDPNQNGDSVWGTLINTYTHGHATSSAACKVGDILQFQNVKLSNGSSPQHHTAIVAAVDSQGRPTKVYEENVNNDRTVRLDAMAVNPNTILSGTVHVYRAVARHDVPGQIPFSVVNDTNKAASVTLYFNGKAEFSVPLTSVNTANSYETRSVSSTGGGSWSIGINGHTVRLTCGTGYEVYTLPNGQVSIRSI